MLATSVGLPGDSDITVKIRYGDGEEEDIDGSRRGDWLTLRNADPADTIIVVPPAPAAPTMNPDAASFTFVPTAQAFLPAGPHVAPSMTHRFEPGAGGQKRPLLANLVQKREEKGGTKKYAKGGLESESDEDVMESASEREEREKEERFILEAAFRAIRNRDAGNVAAGQGGDEDEDEGDD